jgi:hypothetical protein
VTKADSQLAERLYPSEEGDWQFCYGYAQNACGAIHFAARNDNAVGN